MNTTAAPPRPRPEAPPPPRRHTRPTDRPRPSMRRAFAVGMLISVVVHAGVAVILYRATFVPVPVSGPPAVPADAVPRAPGLRVYNLSVEEGAEPLPAVESALPVAAAGEPEGPAAAPDTAAPGPAPRGRTVAERLRPRLGDRRLWRPLDVPAGAEAGEPTVEDVERRIARRLGIWNDSAAAAAERARRATDWTVEDGSGGRWGVSPGKIHLGTLTLPLPLMLPPPSGPTGERIAEWNEIQDQAAREAARESFEDRVRAIRERKEREREEAAEEEPPPP